MKKTAIYRYIHFTHAMLIVVLLLTGAILYIPELRTLLIEGRWQVRQFHIAVGIIYSLFLLAAIPLVFPYFRKHPSWRKTFHLCLMVFLGFLWTVTGVYLWINPAGYFTIRQLSITVHDAISLFIIPWILVHIGIWVLSKYRPKPKKFERDRGWLISRRDVLFLFGGTTITLLLGGITKWFQPISASFLASLEEVKRRGYFRIYSVSSEDPVFDPATWRLKVDGLVDTPLELSFEELKQLPKHSYIQDFHCVTGWSVMGVKWDGIPLVELVKQAGVQPEGVYVKMYSSDQIYTETYEWSQLAGPDVIVAYQIDDKPLLESQGAPIRLFHPQMYGYKSIKWLERIEFTNQRDLGYWQEKEGYSLNGYLS